MPYKYRLLSSKTHFHWDLKAGDGEPILSGERYTSKQGALDGIASCKMNSSDDGRYQRWQADNGQAYFVLKAANGEIIGTSATYSWPQARDNGIASCKTNGPTATLEDMT